VSFSFIPLLLVWPGLGVDIRFTPEDGASVALFPVFITVLQTATTLTRTRNWAVTERPLDALCWKFCRQSRLFKFTPLISACGKSRMVGLQVKKRLKICLVVSIQHMNLTDIQADGQIDTLYSAMASGALCVASQKWDRDLMRGGVSVLERRGHVCVKCSGVPNALMMYT